jgi:hypothetical protein
MSRAFVTPSRARRHRWPRLIIPLAGAVLCLGLLAGIASARGLTPKITTAAAARKAAKHDPSAGTLGPAARRAIHRGYLVPHQARYERHKARITRRATAREALSAPLTGPLAPTIVPGKSWQGINDPRAAPPDETGAVGRTRYIELVNSRFAIYNKASNRPIGSGTLNQLVGALPSEEVGDPQIIWDPTTNRFYYASYDIRSSTHNQVAFGFSRSASPNNASNWCKYVLDYGVPFPDFPKLGDSRFFALIGDNVFANGGNGGFLGSDLVAISKPPAGSGCPAASRFRVGDRVLSRNSVTPVPANEIDTNATGWTVARSSAASSTQLRLFRVTRNPNTGNPVIQTNPTSVNVPSYAIPPNAPQQGSVNRIDTMDGRNTQAVAAIDPGHGGRFALWTQHTVRGGAGAEVRWYEIDPATHSLLQNGRATSPSLFQFNGAISPNRLVNGATRRGGDAMVMNYNTSSTATRPGIRMVSKVGSGAQSAPRVVKGSPGQLSGFDCDARNRICRWGDYAGATPDPSAANRVWQVSQFAVGRGSVATGPATSRTWNFVARP